MEKKIEEFAKEKFSFELPEVLVEPSFLDLSVRTDASAVGSFILFFKDNEKYKDRQIRGYVACNDYRFKFEKLSFSDNEVKLKYEFNTDFIDVNGGYSGNIRIITDCGEVNLPYSISVRKKCFTVEDVEIKDLYQFTSFAATDFEYAVKLFFDEKFEEIILKDKEEEKLLRRGLLRNFDKKRALEEFLCHTKNKQPVKLSAAKTTYNYHLAGKSVQDLIIIKKDIWGYVAAEIVVEGDFIRINKREITDKNFNQDSCEILMEIDPSLVKSVRSKGKVTLRTILEEIEIDVNLVNMSKSQDKFMNGKKRFEYISKLIDEYFAFRMGNISAKNVATAMRAALYGLGINENDKEIVEYVGIYLDIITEKTQQARETLLGIDLVGAKPIERLLHAYLLFLVSDDNEKEKWKREVETLTNIKGYQAGFFFLIHMDSRYRLNLERRLEFISKIYKDGLHSTFLLMEAWYIYKSAPDYFTKLDDFTIQTVNWALKHGYFTGKIIIEKFVLLANDLRTYSPLVLRLLKEVYKNWGVEEVVQAICSQLIKKSEFENDDHEWFRLGVKRGIKLTGIYELYIRTMRDDTDEKIENSAFSYFLYDNSLNAKKKALMYSYLVKNKFIAETQDIYKEYEEQIKEFAIEQIKKGEISDSLVIIYKNVLKDKAVLKEVLPYLSSVMFKKKFTCESSVFKWLIVYTRGLKESTKVPFVNGSVFADVSGECSVALVSDKDDNIYPASSFCEEQIVLGYNEFLDDCYEAGDRSIFELVTMISENEKYHKEVKKLPEICEELLLSNLVTEEYKYYIKDRLLTEYYNEARMEELENLLVHYDFESADIKLALRAADLTLSANIYPLSLAALRVVGITDGNGKKIARLISSYLSDADEERREENKALMLEAAYKLMLSRKADAEILSFLRDNYEGGVAEISILYKELRESELLTEKFVAEFLEQMLFSEEMSVDIEKIFEYFEQFENEILSKAVLSFIAYKWLLKDVRIGRYFEKRLYEEAFSTKNHLFGISYLKLLSEKKSLSEEERGFAAIWLEKLVERDIVLPFYKEFKGKCRIPAEIENLNFVFCYADNEDEVSLKYRLLSSSDRGEVEYTTQWVKNVFQGIFVKEFLIFADETVQYYISIKDKNEEVARIVSSGEIALDQEELFEEEHNVSLFSQINMMYVCRELSDEKTLKEYMKNYVVQKEIIGDLFSDFDKGQNV